MSNPTFTYQDGLNVQSKDLDRWKKKLSAECYCALEAHCEAENAKLTPSEKVDGYRVFRGNDLTGFVLNWSAGE